MSTEEVLTARITADVSEAVEGFRAVQRESEQLKVSVKQVAVSFSGVVTSGMALYGSFERIQHSQYEVAMASKDIHRAEVTLMMLRNNLTDATQRYGTGSREVAEIMERISVTEETLAVKEQRLQMAQQEVAKSYLYMAATIVPNLITGLESTMRLYESLKGVKAAVAVATYAEASAEVTKTGATSTATVVQWLYNKALAVTHALSGPIGWAILGVAGAVTAATVIWMSAQSQQEAYNKTLDTTIDLEAELSRMTPLERLQREYVIVKKYYEASLAEKEEAVRHRETIEKTETVATNYVGEGFETSAAQLRDYGRLVEDLHESVGEAPSYGLVKSFEDATEIAQEFGRVLRTVEGTRLSTVISHEEVVKEVSEVEKNYEMSLAERKETETLTKRVKVETEGFEEAEKQAGELHETLGEVPSFGLVKSFEDTSKAALSLRATLETLPRGKTHDVTFIKNSIEKLSREASETRVLKRVEEATFTKNNIERFSRDVVETRILKRFEEVARNSIERLNREVSETRRLTSFEEVIEARKTVATIDKSRIEALTIPIKVEEPTIEKTIPRREMGFTPTPIYPAIPSPAQRERTASERPVTVSIGRIEVSAKDLGSRFDRERVADDLARQFAHKLALKVITK